LLRHPRSTLFPYTTLFRSTIVWARMEEVSELSLNFSVFAEFLRADRGLVRALLVKLDRLFQLERLHSFNRKFFPEWRRRYFCFEDRKSTRLNSSHSQISYA